MSRHVLLIFGLVTVVLSGCGGSGGSNRSVDRFAGHYVGTYTSTTTDAHGTVDLTVAADGTITGTADDSRHGSDGVIFTGSQIHVSGDVVLITHYGTGPAIIETNASGIVDLAGDTLTGTLSERQGDISEPFAFSLERA